MGVYEDKLAKHQKKTLGTLRDLHGLKTVGIIEENRGKGLLKIAKPVGVIGALTPVTNASSTITCNGLPMLKTRNAVIFAPRPKAKATCELIAGYMREGLRKVGAPVDLIQNIRDPSEETTQEPMRQVDLIVATGVGPGVGIQVGRCKALRGTCRRAFFPLNFKLLHFELYSTPLLLGCPPSFFLGNRLCVVLGRPYKMPDASI